MDIKIRDGVLTQCHFGIAEMQRFFQEAVRGKTITSLPHLLARICGTCSNAHLLASIASVEHGLQITVSEQTTHLRKLLNYGLMIRDHGLHLYVLFSLTSTTESLYLRLMKKMRKNMHSFMIVLQ